MPPNAPMRVERRRVVPAPSPGSRSLGLKHDLQIACSSACSPCFRNYLRDRAIDLLGRGRAVQSKTCPYSPHRRGSRSGGRRNTPSCPRGLLHPSHCLEHGPHSFWRHTGPAPASPRIALERGDPAFFESPTPQTYGCGRHLHVRRDLRNRQPPSHEQDDATPHDGPMALSPAPHPALELHPVSLRQAKGPPRNRVRGRQPV